MPVNSASPSRHLVVIATLLLAMLATGVGTRAAADVSDTISVVKAGETLSNVEIVARLAEATFTGGTRRVVIGRDDNFADNMASAVMQTDAPLLLVPPAGPIPERVSDLLRSYAPEEVVVLGGELAVQPAVTEELARSYRVVRRSGETRFETAIDIAEQEVPAADTAILARGFGAAGAADPSQAFADALAAGGWAANNGWPILLSPTDALPATVEAYLTRSNIRNVMVMGGTAAISQGVEDRLRALDMNVTRVGGATRFATAIAVAEMRGATSAADVQRVVLVEGQADNAWAAGFAAAGHSAVFDAPIVLANGSGIPEPTGAFLSPPTFAQDGFFSSAVLTCATLPSTCEQARVLRGLPAQATVTFAPADGGQQEAGTTVSATISTSQSGPVTLDGDCVPTTSGTTPTTLQAAIAEDATGVCTLTVTISLPGGSTQVDSASFTVLPPSAQVTQTSGILTGVTSANAYSWVPGSQEQMTTILPEHQLFVDGVNAALADFLAAAGTGDLVTLRTTTRGQTTTVAHLLTNRTPAAYTQGAVGDVDLNSQQAWIVEPVSGRKLRSFAFAGASLELGGATTDLPTFRAHISEGDSVFLVTNGSEVTTIQLTDGQIQGMAIAVDTAGARFRINTGGLPSSPNAGDEPGTPADLSFLVTNQSSTQSLQVDGAVVSYNQFQELLANGVQARYRRTGGVEVFELTGLSSSSTRTGLATETHDVPGTGSLSLLVLGQGRIPQRLTPNARLFIGGAEVSRSVFNAAYTAGDMLQITTPTATAPQQVSLTQQPAAGTLTNGSVTARTYDIINGDGTIFQGLSWVGDPFRIGVSTHVFFINNQSVEQSAFENQIARPSGSQTIRTVPGNDPTSGGSNEHRLMVQPTG